MADVDQVIEHLLNEYDNSVGARQCSLAEAIEITEGLIEALQERLDALHADEQAPDPQ